MEWTSAWRAVRARGRSAVFTIGLLALAIASNAVMFAFADSLVFRRVPFPEADRIFTLSGQTQPPERIDLARSASLLRAWRAQSSLVAAVGSYLQKNVFLRGDGPLEQVKTADVTIGFFDVLGVSPRWGRGFAEGDDTDPSAFAVVIGEELARRRFGPPAAAVGQVLDATSGKHVVIGVMDSRFVFPNATYQMWRALDPVGPLTRNFGAASPIARLAPGVPNDDAVRLLVDRSAQVGAAAGLSSYTVRPGAFFGSAPKERRTMVLMLLGAALSLLLAACANIASLELAGAARKARTAAVQLALGAPRWSLARVAAIEGAIMVALGFAAALALTVWVTSVLRANLPDSLRLTTSNRIDVDARAFAAMLGLAALAWIVGALPMVLAVARARLNLLLKVGDRGASASRRLVWWRQAFTLGQVAFAVALMIGSVLFVRSYQNLLAVEKGFDSRDLYSITWTFPATAPPAPLRERALEHLRATPGVDAVTTSSPPPSVGDSPSELAIEIGGRGPAGKAYVGRKWVDLDYFSVVGLPLKQGSVFGPGSRETDVVLPESFARRYFPGGDAVGQSFRRSPTEPWLTVIGVVGDFRTARTRMPSPEDREIFHYALTPLPAARPSIPTTQPAAPPAPAAIDTGGSYRFLALTVRLNDRLTPRELLARVRAIDPGVPVIVSSVDEQYGRQTADTRLSSQVVGAFGGFAFAIAMTGVMGVVAFIVSLRAREIGIRMALGADGSSIQWMVLSSSLRVVFVGLLVGTALAMAGSRAIESQLFGVSPTAAPPYLITAVTVLAAAALATWLPARHAAKVDPAITLREE